MIPTDWLYVFSCHLRVKSESTLSRCQNIKKVVRVLLEPLNVLLVRKKIGENYPMIILKHLNQFIPYQQFNIEGLYYLREM